MRQISYLFFFLFSVPILILLIVDKAFAHNFPGQKSHHHLGHIIFKTSGDAKAQPYFEKGVLLLHSFEYNEAKLAFKEAQAIDPNFLLAYWGEAMTYNHPLWFEQDYAAGSLVIEKIKLLRKNNQNFNENLLRRETLLLSAIQTLYGPQNKKNRDLLYADKMRELYQAYPNDDELASFYALALLGSSGSERNFQIYMQAAGIVDEIYTRAPTHPGALHYAIHSFDDPIHAPLGLRAARIYAKTAPDASHALHMPSHIFLALGMWKDVVTSNKAAWEAGVRANPDLIADRFTIDDMHALAWLEYGYLQQGLNELALRTLKQMATIVSTSSTPQTKWYYALMRATYFAETKNYQSELPQIDMQGTEISAYATDLYIQAHIALSDKKNNKALTQAKYFLHEIDNLIENAKPNETFINYFTATTKAGIKIAKLIRLELKAEILLAKGDLLAAIAILEKATQLESEMSFGYGPPLPIKPSFEMLATIYKAQSNYLQAYKENLKSLKRMPNRRYALAEVQLLKQKLDKKRIEIPEVIPPYFNKLMRPEFFH